MDVFDLLGADEFELWNVIRIRSVFQVWFAVDQ